MRIILAPDKFKGCLSAAQVARAMAEGIRGVDGSIDIVECPMADGGEGTVEALVSATGGKIVTRRVTGPLSRMKVDAPIGILGDGFTAVIEMAAASGLHLLKREQYDPTRTTTYGTGELLREAERLGARRIILGIGGSATIDGGIGAAQAWGASFTLDTGAAYREGGRRLTGGDLPHLRSIVSRLPLETQGVEFVVACDVGNPLLGPDGAAAVFGPQKGATPEQVAQLEVGLEKLSHKTRRQDLADRPGAGAAGGLGFGMMAFFDATLRPGIDIVMETLGLRERLKGADLCVTGEGRFDGQSAHGKTPVGVARLCAELDVPCVVVAGSIGPGAEQSAAHGVSAVFSACEGPTSLDDAIAVAPRTIAATVANVVRLWLAGQRR